MSLVNGPVNTVRLQGSVNSINKIMYIFMDFHASEFSQKKCPNIRAMDINTFLVEEFDKSMNSNPKMIFDLMFERGPIRPFHAKNMKEGYLREMGDFFTKSFKLNIETNKAQQSDLVPNVRFHYVDIRDFLIRNSLNIHDGENRVILNNIFHTLRYSQDQLDILFRNIQMIQSEFATLYISLYKNRNLLNPTINESLYSANIYKMHSISEKDNYKLTQKSLYKLLVKYNHEPIKKKITEIINTELHEMFIDFFDYINQILSFITTEIDLRNKFGNHDSSEILFQQLDQTYTYGIDRSEHFAKILKFDDINDVLFAKIINIGVYFMDLYKLRRILDKDYVTNTISYAGAFHSNNYIRLLIKYFGFKLTHYSYLKNNNIKETEKIIKSSNSLEDLNILFYPYVFTQCSDLSSFPKLFT